MIAVLVVTVFVLLVVTVAVAGGLRRLVFQESEVERRLRARGTHTISYALPNGVDPADFRAALLGADFVSCMSSGGAHECLLVECSEGDRARLRRVIESVHEVAYDGTEMDFRPVVFEDERQPTT
jgi:hypothetical protein